MIEAFQTADMKVQTDNNRKILVAFFALLLAGSVLALANICFGGAGIGLKEISTALFDPENANPVVRHILVEFRLPRMVTAALAGGALAAAGLIMQTVFRNPLADPFVLGVNSGASLGVALVLLAITPLGISLGEGISKNMGLGGQFTMVFASTGGAALTLFAVLSLSRKVDIMSILIIGLMISYILGSLVSMLMFFTMAERLQSFINWSFGNYSTVSWSMLPLFGSTILCGLLLSALLVKPLDALLLGERYADSMGVRVQRTRLYLLFAASLLAGTVTGFCGPIGFLGIAAPHLSRYLFRRSEHRLLLPASILIGACLSLGSDLIARGPGLDTSLPLNAITALIGAPVIIAVLVRQRNSKRLFT